MKKLSIFIILFAAAFHGIAQDDFKKDITEARSSYASGKLEDAHFSLMQAMQELDMIIGKEVLKLLPARLDTMAAVASGDHVMANVGFVGATIQRSYGTQNNAEIEIINNSPLIGTINTFLNSGILGGMMRDENTKVVKIQGYKARLEKQPGSTDTDLPTYEMQIPFNNALMTITIHKSSEAQIMAAANSMPLADIAKLIQ